MDDRSFNIPTVEIVKTVSDDNAAETIVLEDDTMVLRLCFEHTHKTGLYTFIFVGQIFIKSREVTLMNGDIIGPLIFIGTVSAEKEGDFVHRSTYNIFLDAQWAAVTVGAMHNACQNRLQHSLQVDLTKLYVVEVSSEMNCGAFFGNVDDVFPENGIIQLMELSQIVFQQSDSLFIPMCNRHFSQLTVAAGVRVDNVDDEETEFEGSVHTAVSTSSSTANADLRHQPARAKTPSQGGKKAKQTPAEKKQKSRERYLANKEKRNAARASSATTVKTVPAPTRTRAPRNLKQPTATVAAEARSAPLPRGRRTAKEPPAPPATAAAAAQRGRGPSKKH
ncbi:hypothetical protein B484DRAFT_437625 [Ochromonadaceae sp. CCMP2298]|nr:hypothetical protein B484DRAFT_437625 [Ochromonadaceae sp. CCMP2298]